MENNLQISANIAQQLHLRMICTHPFLLSNPLKNSIDYEKSHNKVNNVVIDQNNVVDEDVGDDRENKSDYDCIDGVDADVDCAKIQGLKQLFLECGVRNVRNLEVKHLTDDKDVVHTRNDKSHRFVIFVQFKKTLKFLEENFCKKYFSELKYLRLDSDVLPNDRQSMIDEFNANTGYKFLLTTTKVIP